MNNKRRSIDELRDLGDALDESILRASDAEVSEELTSLGIQSDKVVAEMDAVAEEAKQLAGKLRLERAKDAVIAFRSNQPSAVRSDRSGLRSKLEKMRSRTPDENHGLMIAARKGTHLSADDEEGALDDLQQLEAIESEDPEASKE